MDLAVIVLNYNTPEMTLQCVQSVVDEMESLPDLTVLVVDNASTDNSVALIKREIDLRGWPGRVRLISSEQNRGFAGGNNLALKEALASIPPPRYCILMNSDTVARKGALSALIQFMDVTPSAGIAGSALEDWQGTTQRSAFNRITPWSEFVSEVKLGLLDRALPKCVVAPPPPASACRIDWIPGACMIVRREVFQRAGLLDEGYFMYYEDADFCLAASRAGWEVWYVPQSRVVHLVGATSGVTTPSKTPSRRPDYYFESRRRYFVRNFGVVQAALADAFWVSGHLLGRLKDLLRARNSSHPPMLIRDFLTHSVRLRRNR